MVNINNVLAFGEFSEVDELLDPFACNAPLHLDTDISTPEYIRMLTSMLVVRTAEQRLADARRDGTIGGPVHLGIGQEAIPVSVSRQVDARDFVFSAHRSHGHLLALGTPLYPFFCEILGKADGLCGGRGGSMHLFDRSVGFMGSVPIMAGTVPMACGAALNAKMSGNQGVAVSYLGDGAVEEGVVHESFNLASCMQLPIIFVVENNLFASHMHISKRQSSPFISRFGSPNSIETHVVDGNDAQALTKSLTRAFQVCRQTNLPVIVEAITYRWLGHVDWRDDIDVGVNRSASELEAWKRRCPILRLSSALMKDRKISAEDLSSLQSKVANDVSKAWDQAMEAPYPLPESLLKNVRAEI